jgi:hypothetical protein
MPKGVVRAVQTHLVYFLTEYKTQVLMNYSETSAYYQRTTWYLITEHRTLYEHSYEDLKLYGKQK